MRVSVVGFTERGIALASGLARSLEGLGDEVDVSGPRRFAQGEGVRAFVDVATWAQEAFLRFDALVFVSAAGIAVRAIAPLVEDKYRDPAVVCVDEAARFAIPLLSGHVGGANALARDIAAILGAQPVITTATDARGVFAVDEWATAQGLAILDRTEAKAVSADLLAGRAVGFASDFCVDGDPPAGLVAAGSDACARGISVSLDVTRRPFAHTLRLVPQVVTVGVGCRRGVSAQAVSRSVDACLDEARLARAAVRMVATIDRKADEPAIVELARAIGVPLRTHAAAELAKLPGDFSSSEFVERTVGVDNVCERAACAGGERLLLGKRASGGVAVALAALPVRLGFGLEKGRVSG